MPELIISDTSSLVALTNINELDILKKLYHNVTIPPEVEKEFGLDIPDWIEVKQVIDEKKIRLLNLDLDLGESSCIALELEHEKS